MNVSRCSEVRIDFSRMRILKKKFKVRRLDDGGSKWIWYCMLSQKWKNYGHKVEPPVLQWKKKTFQCVDSGWSPRKQDAKGHNTPKSEAIELSFQRNPRSSFTFNMGSEIYEINFRGEVYIKRNMTGVC